MGDEHNALVVFVDIRGFTKWSEANEVYINLGRFIIGFMNILRKRFPEPVYQLRPRGDGALLVHQPPGRQTMGETSALLGRLMRVIANVEREFQKLCTDFGKIVGHGANLALGWGVVRGNVFPVEEDWAGHNLNKCARLCSEARPFGIIVDADDFPDLPKEARHLVKQVRRLRGIGDIPVWVSPEIATTFIPRERLRETPEVHVAGMCFAEDTDKHIRVLLARRAIDRALFPGKIEGCGGQLRHSESFTEGVRRHFHLEFGIDVQVLPEHCFYEIRQPEVPVIPGIRYLCRQIGDSTPASHNHSEVWWATEEELRRTPAPEFVGDLKQETIQLLNEYRLRTSS
jgi:class 3 adenylate cyclase